MNKSTAILIVVGVIAFLCWQVDRYRDNALEYKSQRDAKTKELNGAVSAIEKMKVSLHEAAALDIKHTGELNDAKDHIAQLERDVAAGKRRLQLNATCTERGEASASSMGYAPAPRLTNSAERDYFTLLERIATVTKQVTYLQGYINTQCQN